MSTALIIPFGASDTENGRARQAVWDKVRPLWERGNAHILMVAADPLFGTEQHPFSVARAVNNAVRLAPPEVDRFATIGADALPDWSVVDWAAAELETRPWTLLFGKGASLSAEGTALFTTGAWTPGASTPGGPVLRVQPFETPCVGPIAFTREAFLAVRGYDERFEGWGYEDVDLWARLRRAFPQPAHEDRVSPYPLVQFDHPVDHHDLTDGNPNVRLWAEKCAARAGHADLADHPADCLYTGADVSPRR